LDLVFSCFSPLFFLSYDQRSPALVKPVSPVSPDHPSPLPFLLASPPPPVYLFPLLGLLLRVFFFFFFLLTCFFFFFTYVALFSCILAVMPPTNPHHPKDPKKTNTTKQTKPPHPPPTPPHPPNQKPNVVGAIPCPFLIFSISISPITSCALGRLSHVKLRCGV